MISLSLLSRAANVAIRRSSVLSSQNVLRNLQKTSIIRLYSSEKTNETEKKIEKPEKLKHQKQNQHRRLTDKGPMSWKSLSISLGVLGIIYVFLLYARQKKDRMIQKEKRREVGKAMIGGSFELMDHDGNTKTDKDFHGKWILLYFGFTHCPDICPDEMEKLSEAVDLIRENWKDLKQNSEVVPLFITVDPDRDGIKEVKQYVKEFHPDMIGLTGTKEQIEKTCKTFRVYFSSGPRDEDDDYIVDHTVIIYLIDPNGEFVDYYGQTKTAKQIASTVVLKSNLNKF